MRALTPHFFHALLVISLSLLPLISGGWGKANSGAAPVAMALVIFGVVVAIALNEYLVKISSLDWEHQEGRWKIVLPIIAALVMGNLLGPDGVAQRAFQGAAFGLIGLTALRTQTQTDVLLRVGVMAAIAIACWGIAGTSFFLVVPLVFLIALQMTYDPPEPRAYLSYSGHAQLVLFVLLLSAALVIVFITLGAILQWMGLELNPASHSATQSKPAEPREVHWWDFAVLALLAYFGLPYLLRLFNKQDKGDSVAEFSTESSARRIAEQFKRVLGRSNPRERIIYAYHEMLKGLIRLGFIHDAAQTPEAIGRQFVEQRGVDPDLCATVNQLFYRACYSDQSLAEADAQEMEQLVDAVIEVYRQSE